MMSIDERASLVLVTGGARSGKSTFAEKLARQGGKDVIYLATAKADDVEMKKRIEAHRRNRPENFRTVEEAYEPHRVLKEEATGQNLVLLDCLTLLISNLILRDLDRHGAKRKGEDIFADDSLLQAAGDRALDYCSLLAETAVACPADVVVVTNEVGLGLVPGYPLGRLFRDCSGWANQLMAEKADQVWMVVCGIPRRFK